MPIEPAVDPTIPPAARTTLRAKPQRGVTLGDLVKDDVVPLMDNPGFRRFIFTVLENAGIYVGSFHPEAGILHYAEGRRGLGLDILRTLETRVPDAHIRILQEAQPYKEAPNGRRNNYDRNFDGDSDDGNADD